MKRDFQEEYQNYIESDMPDLWSRIEPNLKEKNGKREEEGKREEKEKKAKEGKKAKEEKQEQEKNAKRTKVIYFLKRAIPAAACLCVLIIGIGVMGVKKSSDLAPMESESGEQNDTGMDYETNMEKSEAAAEEYVMTDESFDDAGVDTDESATPAEETADATVQDMSSMDSAGGADRNHAQTEKAGSLSETAENAVEIERAVLYKIAVASEEMQEMGYAYAYTFRLEDESCLKVYLTKEQCDDLEDKGIEIKRKETYFLRVYPFKNPETDSKPGDGEGFLEKIEKLP